MTDMHVKLTFTTDLLGTVPANKKIFTDYIADENLDETKLAQELDTIKEDLGQKGLTTFHMVGDDPILYAYVIKGFFKDACGMLRRVKGTLSSGIKAYKKEIDGLVFVTPRQIRLNLPAGAGLGFNERPLRAQTAQGDRIALARSHTCPSGTTLSFKVTVLGGNIDENTLSEWFNYGELRGLGQWRNAGWGSFTWLTLEQ